VQYIVDAVWLVIAWESVYLTPGRASSKKYHASNLLRFHWIVQDTIGRARLITGIKMVVHLRVCMWIWLATHNACI